jgi:hypothetical protein
MSKNIRRKPGVCFKPKRFILCILAKLCQASRRSQSLQYLMASMQLLHQQQHFCAIQVGTHRTKLDNGQNGLYGFLVKKLNLSQKECHNSATFMLGLEEAG